MFRHVVLLRFDADASEDQRRAVLDGLARLPAQIPEIRDYRFGVDAGINDWNYDLAVVADFDDSDGYLVYRDHPVHTQLIADHIRPILDERAAAQFEF